MFDVVPKLDECVSFGVSGFLASAQTKIGDAAKLKKNKTGLRPVSRIVMQWSLKKNRTGKAGLKMWYEMEPV